MLSKKWKTFLDRHFYFCSFLLLSTARGCMNELMSKDPSIALLTSGFQRRSVDNIVSEISLSILDVFENLKNWSMDPLIFDDFLWISRIDCSNFLTAKVPWVKWLECVNWRMIHTTNTLVVFMTLVKAVFGRNKKGGRRVFFEEN